MRQLAIRPKPRLCSPPRGWADQARPRARAATGRGDPFDSVRKRMTTVHAITSDMLHLGDSPYVAFTKGAVDSVLELCGSMVGTRGPVELSESCRERIMAANATMARRRHAGARRRLPLCNGACRGRRGPDLHRADRHT